MSCEGVFDKLNFRLLYEGLFEDFIDRSNAEIPDTFVPSAKGIAVFHDMLLYLANPLAMYGTHRPYRWVNVVSQGKFMMGADPYILSVCRYGKLWSIERRHLDERTNEVLAFVGPTPIFHRKQQAAMTLAKCCHPNPREEAQWCLSWVPIAA
jgi:hypothetical protein